MKLPAQVQVGVESLLGDRAGGGGQARIVRAAPVRGGCINPSARLESEDGKGFFLKWNDSAPVEMFVAEADGLRALAEGVAATVPGGVAANAGEPGLLRVPDILGWGGSGTSADPGWLLMELLPQGRPGPGYGARLGRGLALLHGGDGEEDADPGDGGDVTGYGWRRDNFIGSLPQENQPSRDWSTFWRDRRLAPQLRMARSGGWFSGKEGRILDTLLDRLDDLLPPEEMAGPGLLHGDLWSGNYYPGPGSEPVLIDPAVYRGEGEVDLAMMELFGSFPRGFLEGYQEIRPLRPAYDAFRRDLYQLYYLLVHVNLFGGGYAAGSLAAARRVLAAV